MRIHSAWALTVGVAVACLGLCVTPSARASLVGNNLVARANASDGDNRVLQVYRTDPIPGTGFVTDFRTFKQAGTSGPELRAYVLRPTGNPNEVNVLFDSGDLSVAGATDDTVVTFDVPDVAVQAGDLIAHFKRGVPYTDGDPEDSVTIFYPVDLANTPTQGQTFTLGSANYPNSGFNRTYSFAANFEVPEPGALGVLALAGIGVLARRRRRA